VTMAQTKRKRRTKHRGNAAGTVEVRGRTGRPPSPDERKKQTREKTRQARLNKPPTWRQSLNRALLAGAFIFLFMVFTTKSHQIVAALVFAVLAIGIYVPSGFYLESYLYKRRMRRQAGPR
jgi:Flp pilus assembly protein TadB